MMIKSLYQLLISFGKIGFTALGGGHSMLKLIEFETVINRHWLAKDEFISMLGSTFLFPGLTAVKLSALIGYHVAGILGMLVAVLCLNLPGLLLALFGYYILSSNHSPAVDKILMIVQYGALAMLAAATFSIADGVFKNHFSLLLAGLTVIFFIALSLFNLSPFWGLLGFIAVAYLCMMLPIS